MVVPDSSTPTYQLGLCMAGAATGGAYSAGVLDFLIEAMNEWQALKNANDPSVPQWDVSLSEIIGTSAGGITATLAVACLNTPHQPLPRDYKLGDPAPKNNPLFQTWVKEMNSDQLLDLDDLNVLSQDNKVHVRSVLNADFMANTAPRMIKERVVQKTLPSYAQNLCLSLTTTNMRGVPYSLKTFHSINPDEAFYMRQHADYCRYFVTTTPDAVTPDQKKGQFVLDISQPPTDPIWTSAIDASRATSAFPGGFATVRINTPRSHYEHRLDMPPCWKAALAEDPDAPSSTPHSDEFSYSAVDGGTVDNEPFGLLEDFMTARHGQSLEADGKNTWGSVILIDPFPSVWDDPSLTEEGMPLLPMLAALISSIRAQAMFKKDEIESAADDDCMSKFMIRPDRDVKKGQIFPIATGTMGGFGGILDEKLRLHDFQLGRANCQDFLKEVFCIKREEALQNNLFSAHSEHLTTDRIPIIPVVGKAAEPIPMPEWPSYTDSERKKLVTDLLVKFRKRFEKVVRILLNNFGVIKPSGFFNVHQKMMNIAGGFVHSRLVNEAMERVETGIEAAMKVFRKTT
ncbi:unnamed protein product [Agarophyton chilense]|eukprot:gb/GEZJ01004259.1/.p1 GENE.gb/GEZJ01004259.1/~~gb/GEZJ01004259.1/.p1  ORF type:complete len:571 (+),score=85.97 gb/GEZJ01004259.1/:1067-2779(+)